MIGTGEHWSRLTDFSLAPNDVTIVGLSLKSCLLMFAVGIVQAVELQILIATSMLEKNILAAGLAVTVCGADIRPDRHSSKGRLRKARSTRKKQKPKS